LKNEVACGILILRNEFWQLFSSLASPIGLMGR